MSKAGEALDTAQISDVGAQYEHQTPRDIRQWAICEAGRYLSDPDRVLTTARRYAAYVETGDDVAVNASPPTKTVFRLISRELDGTTRYLVAPPYRERSGNLSPHEEVAQVYPHALDAQVALAASPLVDGRHMQIEEGML